jgi:archaellin
MILCVIDRVMMTGVTGLEAAIVQIAFIVMASVFSNVVLGAGFFTTRKAQETVYWSRTNYHNGSAAGNGLRVILRYN